MEKRSYFKYPVSVSLLFLLLIAFFYNINVCYSMEKMNTAQNVHHKKIKKAISWFNKGEKYYTEGNLDKAETAFVKCLNYFPEYDMSLYFLSKIYYKKNNLKKALIFIKKAKKIYKASLKDKIDLMKYNLKTIDTKLAEQKNYLSSFGLSCKGGPGENALNVKTNIIQTEENKRNLDLMLSRMQKKDSYIPGYDYIHGNILFKLGKNQEAEGQYLTVLKKDPLNKNAYNNLAYIYYLAKQYKNAIKIVETAENLNVQINKKLTEDIKRVIGISDYNKTVEKFPNGIKRVMVNTGDRNNPAFVNTYIVFNEKTGAAIIIDPGAIDKRITNFISSEKLRVKLILNTHCHHDHIGANRHYASLYKVNIAAHKDDLDLFFGKNRNNKPDKIINKEKTLLINGLAIRVLPTPGHSPGSLCFLINNHLFSGDTLFKGSIGSVNDNSMVARMQKMNQEISNIKEKLFTLPSDTLVFPGHGPFTTINAEKSTNPFLNRNLSVKLFKDNFTKLESVSGIEEYGKSENEYDLRLMFKNSSDLESFKTKYGDIVYGLKLSLAISK